MLKGIKGIGEALIIIAKKVDGDAANAFLGAVSAGIGITLYQNGENAKHSQRNGFLENVPKPRRLTKGIARR